MQARGEAPRGPATSSDWRPLFDGRSLDGWEHVGPGKFVIEDGVLRSEDGMGLLWYAKEKLGNCVIRVVYKTGTDRSNSGVYIRIAEKPKDEWYAVHHGFEVQIMDYGSADRRTGSIYTFAKAAAQPSKPREWNTLEITLKGNTDFHQDQRRRGFRIRFEQPRSPGRRPLGRGRSCARAPARDRATSACRITTRSRSSTSRKSPSGRSNLSRDDRLSASAVQWAAIGTAMIFRVSRSVFALRRFILHAYRFVGDLRRGSEAGAIIPSGKAVKHVDQPPSSSCHSDRRLLCVYPSRSVSAHPSSGIVVDQQGQVFFQDIVGGAIWKIDAQGKLTKYYDKLGGHWMALDGEGSFSRADLKLVKRITPFGAKPTLLVADGALPSS